MDGLYYCVAWDLGAHLGVRAFSIFSKLIQRRQTSHLRTSQCFLLSSFGRGFDAKRITLFLVGEGSQCSAWYDYSCLGTQASHLCAQDKLHFNTFWIRKLVLDHEQKRRLHGYSSDVKLACTVDSELTSHQPATGTDLTSHFDLYSWRGIEFMANSPEGKLADRIYSKSRSLEIQKQGRIQSHRDHKSLQLT